MATTFRTKTLKGFGYWLNWARDQGYNLDDSLPVLVTVERVVAYIEQLRPGRASFTVSCHVQELYDAVRVMAPAHDWLWLAGIHRAVRAEAIPERDKLGRLRLAHEIEALGLSSDAGSRDGRRLERPAQSRAVPRRADDHLLIRRLLRLRNFTELRLGEHIVQLAGVWMLRLGRHETRGHRPLDVLVPRVVIEGLERYLGHHRRVLLRGEGAGTEDAHDHDALWVSEVGTPHQVPPWPHPQAHDGGVRWIHATALVPGRGGDRVHSACTKTGAGFNATPAYSRHAGHGFQALLPGHVDRCIPAPCRNDGGDEAGGTWRRRAGLMTDPGPNRRDRRQP